MRGHPALPLPAAAPSPSPSGGRRSGGTRLVAASAALLVSLFGVTIAATGASADRPASAPSTTADRVSSTETIPDDTTGDPAVTTDSAPDASEPGAGGTPIPPDGLGDDAELDALATSCFDGDLLACDHLFLQSPVDSAYEEYGDTCGGRQDPGTENWCALGLESDITDTPGNGEPVAPGDLGDDPALDQLAADCYAGDMSACDDLYWDSPLGSDYEDYGNTCGGRVPEGGVNCVDVDDPVPGTGDVPVGTGDVPVGTSDVPVETGDVPVDTSAPTGDIPAPTAEPTGLGDDPELDALAEQCYDGSMAACDDLYVASQSGSAYEEYGDTCAGRQPTGTNRYCEDAFPASGPSPSEPGTTAVPSTTVFVPPPPTTSGSGPSLPPLPTPPVTTVPAASLPTTAPGAPTVPPLPTVDAPTIPPLPGATTVPGTPATSVPTATTVPGAIPPATLEPTGLGTDPMLDGLAESCFDGDMEACDQLWRDAEPGSAYRDYGDTCAGRQDSGTEQWCVVSFPGTATTTTPPSTAPGGTGSVPVPTAPGPSAIPAPSLEPTGLGDDPALDALAQACYDGDLASCDELFNAAPFNSPYQQYGDTCAGRQEPGTFKYCVAAFPTAD